MSSVREMEAGSWKLTKSKLESETFANDWNTFSKNSSPCKLTYGSIRQCEGDIFMEVLSSDKLTE